MMQSLAGGTGSGVGTRLSEIIRDEHSPCFMTSCVVAPFTSGESATQQYNATLALASLLRNVDNIFIMENDDVLRRLEKRQIYNNTLYCSIFVCSKEIVILIMKRDSS